MWRFKPFMHKEQTGLEGRVIDIGSFKVQIRNPIAEGGFSCVYSARDALHGSKQYALKHMICNDEESQELVMKEISVMKTLKGHPNVVTLHAHAIFDMGRTKEAFLLMEYCEKSLVNVLENRGAGFFEEKQVLAIFRDVCNAVFAMHCQTPPIAHRDLKAENLLLGSDGLWKLCDFGSTSTNHKRFERPEEMGIEEDNIRKHTTPAYRAPEMWDLFRREVINEKVDIWVWFRVNDLLPDGMQKSLPDSPPEMLKHSPDVHAGTPKPPNKSNPMPRRSPPPPPSSEAPRNVSSASNNSRTNESTGPLGAFWTTQHAKNSEGWEDKTRPKYDEDTTNHKASENEKVRPVSHMTTQKEQNFQPPHAQKNAQGRSANRPTDGLTKDINLFPDNSNHNAVRLKQPKPEVTPTVQNDTYNAFIAVFNSTDQSPGDNRQKPEKEETLEAEVEKLKDQLAHVSAEKAEITSKYEKLSAISYSCLFHVFLISLKQNEKIEGTVWELQQGFFDRGSPSPDSKQWQAFADNPKPQTAPTNTALKSVRSKNGQQNNQAAEGTNTWGFGSDTFKVVPTASSKINVPAAGGSNNSQRFGESKSTKSTLEAQPAGWAGF
ncbi:probable serine/threonine-protein kinase ddb_g0280111 [Phtheirospermum japonicum]|uniref:non-specific serine/threonine protein kinase n=1 Tax=Phtheirospermum japonicum TaxID=374723 RepID=A0A830D234_9LAMI|nr:probable serine/threonine-protein kinase ddb_g0280111 [Phtheirospermum japonicum]